MLRSRGRCLSFRQYRERGRLEFDWRRARGRRIRGVVYGMGRAQSTRVGLGWMGSDWMRGEEWRRAGSPSAYPDAQHGQVDWSGVEDCMHMPRFLGQHIARTRALDECMLGCKDGWIHVLTRGNPNPMLPSPSRSRVPCSVCIPCRYCIHDIRQTTRPNPLLSSG